MAAYTSTSTGGNWSAAGTWTTAPGTGGPGIGDTVTIAGPVTVDNSAGTSGVVKIGTSGAAGTAAISYSNVTPGMITIGASNQLWSRGDVNIQNVYGGSSQAGITVNAGASLIMDPPTSVIGYNINCGPGSGYTGVNWDGLFFNGTSGSRCACRTDFTRATGSPNGTGAINSLITTDNLGRSEGLCTASYTDFTNIGNSSNFGICTLANSYSVNTSVSITYCTFTNSSIYIALSPGSAWDGNLTFSHNYFLSSLVNTASSASFSLACTIVPSAGTLVCSSNYFDNGIDITSKNLTFSNNCCITQQSPVESAITFGTYSSWSSASYCSGNLFIRSDNGVAGIGLYGPISNCYSVNNYSSDFHSYGILTTAATFSATGCVIENTQTGGSGGIFFAGSTACTITLSNNLVLPNPTGIGSGGLYVNLPTTANAIIVNAEHNTFCGYQQQTGLVDLGEPGYNSLADSIASVRANLVWQATYYATRCWAAQDWSTTPATNALYSNGAGYNGFWNPSGGTCTISGSGTSTPGYNGLVVTNGSLANISHDQTVSSNPFVDSTRNFVSWGTHVGVSSSSVANVTTYLSNIANGTLDTLIPALRSWVCEGFRVTATAFKGTSYSGDASTTDADGNAWSGATPDIGAMAYQSASVPIYRNFTTLGALGN
jgi:hypothetical protein